MWKWISAGLLVLLLGSNGWWTYLALEVLSVEKYRQMEHDGQESMLTTLFAITNELVHGLEKQALLELIENTVPDARPFEKGRAINIPSISFPLGPDGKVCGITSGWKPTPSYARTPKSNNCQFLL
jgi:hypothetical protein